jgi:hypothetical protein
MVDRTKTESSLELLPLPAIQQRILIVRERHVMLDEHLSELDGVRRCPEFQEPASVTIRQRGLVAPGL